MTTGDFCDIEDYAIIGDSRSGALVSREGSIDWLCWPRFDSPAIFAALLDREKGGHWRINPSGGGFSAARRYESSSNVLVTTFSGETGEVRLTDLFFAAPEEYKRRRLLPHSMLIRRLECLQGNVDIEIDVMPKRDFGRRDAAVRRRPNNAWTFQTREGLGLLTSSVPLVREDGTLRARVPMREGEALVFILAFGENEPAVFPPLNEVDELIRVTNEYWRGWAGCITYEGPHSDAVRRSALVLKLLTYAPSGAIVAAPTTSLPEKIGGAYNWDYRFCWLRDASYTVNAFLGLGMQAEAMAFVQWLLHATHLSRPRLQVLYSVLGKPALAEKELSHLSGYKGSRPVRVGNAAHGQLQLDIYGEVINAASLCYQEGARLSRDEKSFLRRLANFVLKNWQQPDNGIWETRGQQQHFVHSKVLCWLALQRLVDLANAGRVEIEVERFEAEARRIAAEVKARGFNQDIEAYAATLDGRELDASVLRLPILHFEGASEPRMASTIETLRRELSQGDLVYRHRNDETGGEGAFLICSFWLIECLTLQGKLDEAEALFDALCQRANDVGLYSEEIDAHTGAFLGNFPQAFTHIGLINAALALDKAAGRAAK